jgi:hypothetical protein
VALPATALVGAVTVMVCAVPGTRVSVAGSAVTPVGNPVIATVTVPVKPLAGVALTLTGCPVPPADSAMVAGEEVRVKSPAPTGLELPLQESNAKQQTTLKHPTMVFERMLNGTPETLLCGIASRCCSCDADITSQVFAQLS